MKRLLALLLLAALTLPITATAQTEVPPQSPGTYVFAGGEYASGVGFATTFGTANHIYGGVWNVTRGIIGAQDATAEPGLAYIHNYKGWRFGLLAAPNIQWVGDESIVTYLSGAAGGLFGYISERTDFGVITGFKFRFGPEGSREGWQTGLWVTYGVN